MNENMDKDKKDKLMSRVKKLLSMLESPNPNEVEVANRKIAEITDKYNLDINLIKKLESKDSVKMVEEIDIELNGKAKKWDRYLCQYCAKFYDCLLILGWKSFTIIGLEVDREIANDLYFTLKSTIKEASKMKNIPHNIFNLDVRPSKVRDDYRLGLVVGIHETLLRLKEEREQEKSDIRDLTIVKSNVIDKFIEDKYPDLENKRSRPSQHCASFYDGIEKGRTISINSQIQ